MTPRNTPWRRVIRPTAPSPLRGPRPVVGRFEDTAERTPEGQCQAWNCSNTATEEGGGHSCTAHALSDIFG